MEQPLRFYSSAQVRELDRRAIADYSIPGYTLMQRAAAVAWRVLHERWPKARMIHVLAGPGNNGGDGYGVARLAKSAGLDARVWQVGRAPADGAAVQALKAWQQDGGITAAFPGSLDNAEVIVDAVLGIGGQRPLEGEYAAAVEAINRQHERGCGVIAIDVPTGLDADTGRVWGSAVSADVTTTFIGRKLGLYTAAGPEHAGDVVFDGLGVPDAVYERVDPVADELGLAELRRWLPRRARTSHKGHHGHVLVVGGDEDMSGAVLMTARAALRVGAGLVSIAAHPHRAPSLIAAQPEVMGTGVDSVRDLAPFVRRSTVIAVGPGLGKRDWGRELWSHIAAADRPLVVDADGLNWLAQNHQRRDDWILTPHPGEAARLLGVDTKELQADRPSMAARLRERFGGIAVLKGAGTLVRGERLGLCTHGNPGMGSGGMGDVLTGVIAGLVAQGLPLEAAARCGVLIHSLAGDRAATVAERGLLASDVIGALRHFANP